ncbi:hypothetical protein G6F63_014993 [Rhizopus arrhizus]|nr:hypothetical protein G6F63_014993 [Rhizopus arrhizus]
MSGKSSADRRRISQQAVEHRDLHLLVDILPAVQSTDAQILAVLEFREHTTADRTGQQATRCTHALDDRRADVAGDGIVDDFDEIDRALLVHACIP